MIRILEDHSSEVRFLRGYLRKVEQERVSKFIDLRVCHSALQMSKDWDSQGGI